MKEYNIKFAKVRNVVIGITLPVLLFILFFVSVLMSERTSDKQLIAIASVGLMISLLGNYLLLRKAIRKATLIVTEEKFVIKFKVNGTHAPESLEIPLSDIQKYFTDQKNKNIYLSFESVSNPSNFLFFPIGAKKQDKAVFGELTETVHNTVAIANNDHTAPRITHISPYQSWWGKAFGVVAFAILLLVLTTGGFTTMHQKPNWIVIASTISIVISIVKVIYYNIRKTSIDTTSFS